MNTKRDTSDQANGRDGTVPQGHGIGRIVLHCETCNEGVDFPDKGLGRASAAAWRTRHQGHTIS